MRIKSGDGDLCLAVSAAVLKLEVSTGWAEQGCFL